MLITILQTIIIIIISVTCFAENCPSPSDLQQGKFNNWQPLTLDNATELTDEDKHAFQHHVKSFALAEWEEDAPEGPAHCYYNGRIKDGSYLNAYLVKQNLKPSSVNWKQIIEGEFQCASRLRECSFTA